jgi:hypothetical protein
MQALSDLPCSTPILLFDRRRPGILPPRPRDLLGHRAAAVNDGPLLGAVRKSLSLTAASTVAGVGGRDGSSRISFAAKAGLMSPPGPSFSTRSSFVAAPSPQGFDAAMSRTHSALAGTRRIARSSRLLTKPACYQPAIAPCAGLQVARPQGPSRLPLAVAFVLAKLTVLSTVPRLRRLGRRCSRHRDGEVALLTALHTLAIHRVHGASIIVVYLRRKNDNCEPTAWPKLSSPAAMQQTSSQPGTILSRVLAASVLSQGFVYRGGG